VPGAADDAVIDLGANSFTVTHSAGNDAVNSLTDQAAFTLSGGSLSFAAASMFGEALTLTKGATLSGAGDITVLGQFAWLGGTVSGPAGSSLAANGGLVLNPPTNSSDELDGRSLTNNAAAVFTGDNSAMYLADGAALNNGSPTNPLATFTVQVSAPAKSIAPDRSGP
jgi:hypothetical protein